MQPHEKIAAALAAANEAGRTGLVAFLTAGYPQREQFIATLMAVASASDVVEIGVPFSDPMADGMTIQRSSFKAIENGVTLRWIFTELERAGKGITVPLVMMSYLNPLLAYGYAKLAEKAKATGVCGFIVPDLPFEESGDLRLALERHGIGLIQLLTPATPAPRMKKLADASRGFVYAVTITGITGGDGALPEDLTDYLDRVAGMATLPVCAGFGIRTAKDVANVGKHASGAIVGSALVEVLERGDDPAKFLRTLRS